MKELNVPQSGKWGDHVVRRNHYGQYVCKYSPPQKRRTADKGDVESDFQKVSEAWEDLPDEKRPAWSIGATRVRSRARLGKTSALDARALFFKLNLAQLRMGLEVLTDFPGRADFGPNPVGLLTITWAGGRPVLKVRVSGVPAEPIKVIWLAAAESGQAALLGPAGAGLAADAGGRGERDYGAVL